MTCITLPGGKLDREIWHEFARDGDRLRLTAASISKSASWIAETSAAYDSSHDDDEFPEGKILTRLHQRKERNHRATDNKKRKVLQETSRLACEACGFDFAAIYGDLGYGFAECHHTVPVAELTEDHRTKELCGSSLMFSLPGFRLELCFRRLICS